MLQGNGMQQTAKVHDVPIVGLRVSIKAFSLSVYQKWPEKLVAMVALENG